MRTLLFTLFAGAALAASGAAPKPSPPREFPDLTPGRYEVRLTGLLCSVCERAVVAEVAKLKVVDSVTGDFASETIVLSVKNNKKLKISTLRRALSRAARRANLGASYDLAEIKYLP